MKDRDEAPVAQFWLETLGSMLVPSTQGEDSGPTHGPAPGLGIVLAGSGTFPLSKLDRTTLRPKDADGTPVRGYRLLVIGENQHTAHRLPRSGDVSIGRSESADIQVQDPLMSRIHCKFHIGPNLAVSDQGSSNGTVVRGRRVPGHERTPISVGDTIEIGSTVFIVQPEFSRGPSPDGVEHTDSGTRRAEEDATAMDRVYKLARRIARSQINVLLLGETGVGKEVMARTVHQFSARASKPFLGLNCASLNEQLFESELFGYERGAFTGAQQLKPGLIETADGGTIFLDEVGEMPLSTQAKLLRVLEERQVMRVGGLKPRDIDVRFIAATNQHLEKEIEEGNFREDLFYRLNGISLVIPPLRERVDEIPSLARTFIAEAVQQAGYDAQPVLSREALDWMTEHDWPGNIRELRNAVNRAVLLATAGVIQPEHLRSEAFKPRTGRGSARSTEARETADAAAVLGDIPPAPPASTKKYEPKSWPPSQPAAATRPERPRSWASREEPSPASWTNWASRAPEKTATNAKAIATCPCACACACPSTVHGFPNEVRIPGIRRGLAALLGERARRIVDAPSPREPAWSRPSDAPTPAVHGRRSLFSRPALTAT